MHKPLLLLFTFFITVSAADASLEREQLLNRIDLNRPGLEAVESFKTAGETDKAITALLAYYKNRNTLKHPDVDFNGKTVPTGENVAATHIKRADDALNHVFYVMSGYEPYFYGGDINWQYWPVKDNELRWQLHRMPWWESMGLVYASTGDEKYAQEWIYQYKDWIVKNPLGLSADNDRFAWRALEVSERLDLQSKLFLYFISSPAFDEDFLVTFLNNYANHAEYLITKYSAQGNHLLFQAQRIVYAGTFFPEFLNANAWQQSGIDKLNEQITIQVYPDGLQNELSFNYHVACVQIFYKAYQMLYMNGITNRFPPVYLERLERMILAVTEFSFPDYTYPMFSDAKLVTRSAMLRQIRGWTSVFPDNPVIQYFGNDGKKGALPAFTSSRMADGGIYSFRNGWTDTATVMVLKASPPAEWHSQPDNGTFELWVKGRNFFPDAGAYIYAGDASINEQREYFRQTRLHNTLTLDNKNLTVDAVEKKWTVSDTLDMLLYENPSYPGLIHRRSVFFVNKQFFVIADEAIGTARGNVAIHYGFKEGSVVADQCFPSVTTRFTDLNNVTLRCFTERESTMVAEESFVSYAYNQKVERPAYAIQVPKTTNDTVRFLTVIAPFTGMVQPVIEAEFTETGTDKLKVKVKIDNKTYPLGYQL